MSTSEVHSANHRMHQRRMEGSQQARRGCSQLLPLARSDAPAFVIT